MSDIIIQGRRSQSAYRALGVDDREDFARINARGELCVPNPYDQFVQDGRAYIASNVAQETANDLGNTSYVSTQPAFVLDVPTDTTVIPLEVYFRQGGTVAGGTWTGLMELDTVARFTSGGVAVVARNYRYNATEPNSSLATLRIHSVSGTDLLTAANTQDEAFFGGLFEANVDGLLGNNLLWSVRDRIPAYLVGPASLVVHAFESGTAPSFFWHVIWAEIPTVSVV